MLVYKKHRIISERLVPELVVPPVCLDMVYFLHFVSTKLPDCYSLTNRFVLLFSSPVETVIQLLVCQLLCAKKYYIEIKSEIHSGTFSYHNSFFLIRS